MLTTNDDDLAAHARSISRPGPQGGRGLVFPLRAGDELPDDGTSGSRADRATGAFTLGKIRCGLIMPLAYAMRLRMCRVFAFRTFRQPRASIRITCCWGGLRTGTASVAS